VRRYADISAQRDRGDASGECPVCWTEPIAGAPAEVYFRGVVAGGRNPSAGS